MNQRALALLVSLLLCGSLVAFPRFDLSSPSAFLRDCGGKIVRLSRRKYNALEAQLLGNEVAEERQIARLRKDRRDLTRDPVVLAYLARTPVYVSLTTSPRRIHHVPKVLATLDLEHVARVILAIPQRFGRDQSEYLDIPSKLTDHPKVQILRPETDLGPATKLIPGVEHVRANEPRALMITVDDDIGYPLGMINELITAAAYAPGAAVGLVGHFLRLWGIASDTKLKSPQDAKATTAGMGLKPVELLEGFAGVAYPVELVPTALIRDWVAVCAECRTSDDLVFSMALEKSGIPRYKIVSQFANQADLLIFGHGLQSDALHRGAGLAILPTGMIGSNFNPYKYQRAYEALKMQ